jgi:hypothetical protein
MPDANGDVKRGNSPSTPRTPIIILKFLSKKFFLKVDLKIASGAASALSLDDSQR